MDGLRYVCLHQRYNSAVVFSWSRPTMTPPPVAKIVIQNNSWKMRNEMLILGCDFFLNFTLFRAQFCTINEKKQQREEKKLYTTKVANG